MAGTVHVELDDRVVLRDRDSIPVSFSVRLAALHAAALCGKPLELRLRGAQRDLGNLYWWSSIARSEGMRVRWELPDEAGVAFAFVHASDRSAVTS